MSHFLVKQSYEHHCQIKGYQSDAAQLMAVALLDDYADAWGRYKQKRSSPFKKLISHPPIPKGVYLWGGVGRGKSFLLDCFYHTVPLKRKTRLHFHEFMREVQRQLNQLSGVANPLHVLAERIAKKHKLICFDEFHIAHISDAMILHRLLEGLLAQGVGLMMTSNFHPDDLYPGGLHRDRIMPAIHLLKQHWHIQCVDMGHDYRLTHDRSMQSHYLMPLNSQTHRQMQALFQHHNPNLENNQNGHGGRLQIMGRDITFLGQGNGVLWFDFDELCGKPRSQSDYLDLATQAHTIMLSNVPQMGAHLATQARRFTLLIDVLYDRQIQLIVSAQVPPEQLYVSGMLAHEFVRTVSRLNEMQSQSYQEKAVRVVDTQIT